MIRFFQYTPQSDRAEDYDDILSYLYYHHDEAIRNRLRKKKTASAKEVEDIVKEFSKKVLLCLRMRKDKEEIKTLMRHLKLHYVQLLKDIAVGKRNQVVHQAACEVINELFMHPN